MRINFRQGLFKAERDDTGNALLVNQDQTALTARVSNSEIVWSIAQGSKNYTVSEFNPVVIAKIEDLQKHAECWVYVDLDRTKGHKTYGITAHAPIVDDKAPANPVEDQHWFNTATMKQQVYMEATRSWSERVRLIIGKWDGAAFKSAQFGTNVGVTASAKSGIVIYDPVKKAIKDSGGQFVTTEDSIYFENGITHEFAIETNITTAEATEAVPAFAVVSFIDFDKVRLAQYEDTTNVVTAITLNSGATGEPLSLSLQGKIYNELWNWPEVNATLWVGENGQLTDRDPFDEGGVRVRRVPVARVIDKHTVLFAQGLGGVGADGDVRYFIATNAMIGSVRLSLEAAVPNDPVVVGDNDPRLIAKDANGIPVTDFADYVDVTVQEVLEDHDSEINATVDQLVELEERVDVETIRVDAKIALDIETFGETLGTAAFADVGVEDEQLPTNYDVRTTLEDYSTAAEVTVDIAASRLEIEGELATTLQDYSTTVEVTAEIAASRLEIEGELATTLQDYSTTVEVSADIATAKTEIESGTDVKLEQYSTAVEVTDEIAAAKVTIEGDVDTKLEDYSTAAEVTDEIAALETSIEGELALKVDVEAGKQLSAEDFTLELKTKLEHLEGSHYRGVFVSVDALEAITDAVAGDYADVDVVDTPTTRYIWDASDSGWTKQSGEVPALTATQVKALYESNADTNAFTDAEKMQLSTATANATDSFLLDRANHTGTQAADTVDGVTALIATVGENSTNIEALEAADVATQSLLDTMTATIQSQGNLITSHTALIEAEEVVGQSNLTKITALELAAAGTTSTVTDSLEITQLSTDVIFANLTTPVSVTAILNTTANIRTVKVIEQITDGANVLDFQSTDFILQEGATPGTATGQINVYNIIMLPNQGKALVSVEVYGAAV